MTECKHINLKNKGSFFKCLDCGERLECEKGFIDYMESYGFSKEEKDAALKEWIKDKN